MPDHNSPPRTYDQGARGMPRLRIAQVARPERLVRRGDGLVDVGAGGLFEGGPGLARAGIDGMKGA